MKTGAEYLRLKSTVGTPVRRRRGVPRCAKCGAEKPDVTKKGLKLLRICPRCGSTATAPIPE